ncbi:MAG: thiamine diphosphokinase [Syntrophaceae bacterium]|nr:thiamine diphosphokinase [Syntrophaceae bacterium]
MNQNIIIVSGGCSVDPIFFINQIKKMGNRLIICCDGGARHLRNLGIKPDVIIGDMDSIDSVQLANYSAQKIKIIKYPANKDFTDTELALDYALSLKPREILIWCSLGGRIDHTLANVFLLCKGEKKGIATFLMDEHCEVFILNKKVSFIKEAGKTVSLLALTPQVTGFTLTGFLYPLKKGSLKMGESRGISNIINKDRADITVDKGKLLLIKYHRKDFFPEAT